MHLCKNFKKCALDFAAFKFQTVEKMCTLANFKVSKQWVRPHVLESRKRGTAMFFENNRHWQDWIKLKPKSSHVAACIHAHQSMTDYTKHTQTHHY